MPVEKTYPIERSPFYRLRKKSKLAELLGVSETDFRKVGAVENYNVFMKRELGKKPREIQEPVGKLKLVHQKIHRLLRRVESPDYLFSGKRRLSSLDNAKSHIGQNFILTVDIQGFFPNSRAEYICSFLCSQMKMSNDVARMLTDIVTYNGCVPTGSALSMMVAYWAYSKTFDSFYTLAKKKGMKFTLYVDDMTFSSPQRIPLSFHTSINYHLSRIGLQLKRRKIQYYSENHFKVVTGSAISPKGEKLVPNRIRKKILEKLRSCGDLKTTDEKTLHSLHGSLVSARQIEPRFFEPTYRRVKKAILDRRNEKSGTN